MKADIKEKWLAALRSGDYKKGTGKLQREYMDNDSTEYCCLGVLCDIAVKEGVEVPFRKKELETRAIVFYGVEETPDYLPKKVADWAGIEGSNPAYKDPKLRGHTSPGLGEPRYLTLHNDEPGTTFEQIADLIEKYF